MNKSRTIINLATLAIIAGIGVFGYQMWKERETGNETLIEPAAQSSIPEAPADALPEKTPEATVDRSNNPHAELTKLIRRWEDSHAELKGEARDQALRALSQEVISKTSGPEELLSYLGYLAASGASAEYEWMKTRGFRSLFSGPQGEAARDWMLDLKDTTMNRRIWMAAGTSIKPEGFKEYLNALSNPMIQDRVLTEYCKVLAETDGNEAMKTWAKLKPAKVLNYGMIEISRVLAETSDFSAINGMFPGDSVNLARLIRRDLIKRWANFRPKEAAEFIVSRKDVAHPSQMAVVIECWVNKDPAAAAEWLESAEAGAARDEGTAALARHLATTDPLKAWPHVIRISDPEVRLKTAEVVAMEWRRTDATAADQAIAVLKTPK